MILGNAISLSPGNKRQFKGETNNRKNLPVVPKQGLASMLMV